MKLQMTLALALVVGAGCSSKDKSETGGGGGGVTTFTLQAPSLSEPRPTVKVTAKVPATWKVELEPDGSPRFALPGNSSFMKPTVVFLTPSGDDDAGRMKTTIGLQFDDADLAAAKREDLAGGRIWISHTRDNGYLHSRMFIPVPAQRGVVMCVAMLDPEMGKQLPEIRAMCETVTVAGG